MMMLKLLSQEGDRKFVEVKRSSTTKHLTDSKQPKHFESVSVNLHPSIEGMDSAHKSQK